MMNLHAICWLAGELAITPIYRWQSILQAKDKQFFLHYLVEGSKETLLWSQSKTVGLSIKSVFYWRWKDCVFSESTSDAGWPTHLYVCGQTVLWFWSSPRPKRLACRREIAQRDFSPRYRKPSNLALRLNCRTGAHFTFQKIVFGIGSVRRSGIDIKCLAKQRHCGLATKGHLRIRHRDSFYPNKEHARNNNCFTLVCSCSRQTHWCFDL